MRDRNNDTKSSKTQVHLKSWVGWLISGVLILTVALLAALYFTFDRVVKFTIEEEFNRLANDKYILSVDHVHANIFTESIFIEGLSVQARGLHRDSSDHVEHESQVFDFRLGYAEIQLASAKKFLLTDSLDINTFTFDYVDFEIWNYKAGSDKKDFREQIRNALKKNIPELQVRDFLIKNARLKYHGVNKQQEPFLHQIQNLQVSLSNVTIDRDIREEQLFFSPTFEIVANAYSYHDPNNDVKAGRTLVKGNHEIIEIDDFVYQSRGSARLEFPKLVITQPRISEYLFNNSIHVDSVFIQRPKIELINVPFKNSTTVSLKENLTKMLAGFTEAFYTEYIEINDAQFAMQRVSEDGKSFAMLRLDQVNIQVDNTEIIPELALSNSNILFSDGAKLSFDSLVSTNSQDQATLTIGAFSTYIGQEDQLIREVTFAVPGKVDLQVKEVGVSEMDWESLWNERIVRLNAINIHQPTLTLTSYSHKDSNLTVTDALGKLEIKSLPYQIDVQTLSIQDGKIRQNVIGGGIKGIRYQEAAGVYLNLKNLQLAKDKVIESPLETLLSDVEQFSLRNYKLLPKSEKFFLQAKNIFVFPVKERLVLQDISFDVEEKAAIGVSSLEVIGLNWRKYIENQSVAIKKVMIANPTITAHLNLNRKNQKQLAIKELVPEALLGFSDAFAIGSIELENGAVDIMALNQPFFHHQADSVNVVISNFEIKEGTSKLFFFSEDMHLSLRNYRRFSEASNSELLVKTVDLPSKSSSVELGDLYFRSNAIDSLHLSKFLLRGIKWDQYWRQDILEIDQVVLSKMVLQYSREQQMIIKNDPFVLSAFPSVKLKEVLVEEAKLDLDLKEKGHHRAAQVDILITNVETGQSGLSFKALPFSDASFVVNGYNGTLKEAHLSLAQMEGDFKRGHLGIEEIAIKTATSQLKSEKFYMEGISFADLVQKNRLVFHSATLQNSNMNYVHQDSFIQERSSTDSVTFVQQALKEIGLVKGERVEIKNMAVTAVLQQSLHRLSNLNVQLQQVNLTAGKPNSSNQVAFARSVQASFKNYNCINEKSLQQTSIGALQINTKDSFLLVEDILLTPSQEENAFLNNLRYRKTYFRLDTKEIRSRSVDFYTLYNSHKLFARQFYINKPKILVAENLKKARKKGKTPSMPNELLQRLPIDLNIGVIKIHKGDIVYHERSKKFDGTGTVYFTNIDADVKNITNDKGLMTPKSPLTISANCKFMDEGNLNVILSMPLLENTWSCNYQGVLGAMDASTINEMLVPNANVGLRKGDVRTISFNAAIDNGFVKGEMLAKYRSFKIDLYKNDQNRKKGFGSFLSNLLISKNNRKKKGIIYYEATPLDSFVKILWGGLRSGLKDTLLPGFIVKKV